MRQAVSIILMIAAGAALTAAIAIRSRVGHPVTARMRAEAGSMSGRTLPLGGAIRVEDVSPSRPTVLIFIKEGCPCSEAAEPYFRRLHGAYTGRVRFLGVIDDEASVARGWVDRQGTPYPVHPDPERALIKACGAERSAYAAVVSADGTIDRLWPGYSAGMIRELGARLAALTGAAEAPVDVAGAPAELTSGCSF